MFVQINMCMCRSFLHCVRVLMYEGWLAMLSTLHNNELNLLHVNVQQQNDAIRTNS